MIPQNLKWIRQKADLTQQEFAEKFKAKRNDYANWETGRFKPRIDFLMAVCDYYSITLDDLYKKDLSSKGGQVLAIPSKHKESDFQLKDKYIALLESRIAEQDSIHQVIAQALAEITAQNERLIKTIQEYISKPTKKTNKI